MTVLSIQRIHKNFHLKLGEKILTDLLTDQVNKLELALMINGKENKRG